MLLGRHPPRRVDDLIRIVRWYLKALFDLTLFMDMDRAPIVDTPSSVAASGCCEAPLPWAVANLLLQPLLILDRLPVRPLVSLRAPLPREIHSHPRPHYPLHMLATVVVRAHCPAHRVIESVCARFPELESGPRPVALIVLRYGIVQPAGRPHDGRRAVFERVDLVQPAWLGERRHQEEIRPGFDQV